MSIKQTGSILIYLIVTFPFLIIITTTYVSLSISSLNVAKKDQYQTHAQFAADAGSDVAVQEINSDNDWSDSGGEVELLNDGKVRTTYDITVADESETRKIVTTTGRTYFPASASTPSGSVTIKTELRAISTGSEFAIVTGVGGLYMRNTAAVIGGDVFINGELNMRNTSMIGLLIAPVDVFVAHQNCPLPSDPDFEDEYPRICEAGENGQPINIQNNAQIWGNVRANNQTDGSNMAFPGLATPHCLQPSASPNCVAPGGLPNHDRDAQKAAVAHNRSGSSAGCSGLELFETWEANTKITGNVVVGGLCTVTLKGDVWITGNLTIRNTARIIVSTGGTTEPDIMVDGSDGISLRNAGSVLPNLLGTGAKFYTYWSAADCSPDCANVTGSDLYDSRDEETISLDNLSLALESLFYARWSRASLYNSIGVGALIGQTVELRNSASITFGGINATTEDTYWVIDKYRRSY